MLSPHHHHHHLVWTHTSASAAIRGHQSSPQLPACGHHEGIHPAASYYNCIWLSTSTQSLSIKEFLTRSTRRKVLNPSAVWGSLSKKTKQKKPLGRWLDKPSVCRIQMVQSDFFFLQPVEPLSNSLRLPFSERSNFKRITARAALWDLTKSQMWVKPKYIFFNTEKSIVQFCVLL